MEENCSLPFFYPRTDLKWMGRLVGFEPATVLPQRTMLPLHHSRHVPSAGVGPAVLSLEGTCFIQLSYEGFQFVIIPKTTYSVNSSGKGADSKNGLGYSLKSASWNILSFSCQISKTS